jgi:MraZ protein
VPESGRELWKGQYNITLDEKGRIVFPLRLRSDISDSTVMITHGSDRCLWIFSLAEWEAFSAQAKQSVKQSDKWMMQRNLFASAQEVEIDKTGRLSIPQSLRVHADLSKDCVIHNIKPQMLELWDAEEYKAYLERSEASFREAMENLVSLDF